MNKLLPWLLVAAVIGWAIWYTRRQSAAVGKAIGTAIGDAAASATGGSGGTTAGFSSSSVTVTT